MAGARLEARDKDGSTPLICKTKKGQTLAVEMLLALGANVKAHDDQGQTALTWAIRLNLDGIVVTLQTVLAAPKIADCDAESSRDDDETWRT